jgi:hypothetical protein
MEIIFLKLEYLLFLLVIPILVFMHFFMNKLMYKRAILFANFEVISRISKKYFFSKNNFQLIIRIIIITLFGVALAQPVIITQNTDNIENYLILLDSSVSMGETDISPSRLLASKDAIKKLVETDQLDRFSLVSFSSYSNIDIYFDTPKSDSIEFLSLLKTHNYGASDLGTAILAASLIKELSDYSFDVILISDGMKNVGLDLDLAVTQFIDSGLEIHIIALGDDVSTDSGFDVDFEGLEEISQNLNGSYFQAKSADQLHSSLLSVLESDSQKITMKRQNVSIELFIIIFCLLLLEWFLSNTKFRSFP